MDKFNSQIINGEKYMSRTFKTIMDRIAIDVDDPGWWILATEPVGTRMLEMYVNTTTDRSSSILNKIRWFSENNVEFTATFDLERCSDYTDIYISEIELRVHFIEYQFAQYTLEFA